MTPKKVFISYAWENEDFAKKIYEFANLLRAHGIDANIDQYEENPDMGWPIWMERQIEVSDYVLIVSTKTYLEKYKQQQNGKGVSWEISSIYQSLYTLEGHNNKFIPIVFDNNDIQYIVKALQPYTYYNVSNNLQKLENRINGVPNSIKPNVGHTPLPEKMRKSLFIINPIDLNSWDKAQWSGVCFVHFKRTLFLGLLFKGDEQSALKIFSDWQEYPNLNDYIQITFIEGNIEKLPPNGYTCLVSPNNEKAFERCDKQSDGDKIIITFNRFQRMYPNDKFKEFNQYKQLAIKYKDINKPIIPVTLKDKTKGFSECNLSFHIDKVIALKNITYIDASDIGKNHFASCCIPKFNKNFPINK